MPQDEAPAEPPRDDPMIDVANRIDLHDVERRTLLRRIADLEADVRGLHRSRAWFSDKAVDLERERNTLRAAQTDAQRRIEAVRAALGVAGDTWDEAKIIKAREENAHKAHAAASTAVARVYLVKMAIHLHTAAKLLRGRNSAAAQDCLDDARALDRHLKATR